MLNDALQIDLASPREFAGVLTQGGFYEEKNHNAFPYKESWVTQYVLSYSNDSQTFTMYSEEGNSIRVSIPVQKSN